MVFFFKQKTAYEILADWSSDVCSSDLPETIGGERNWDYRYTWLRDAGFTLYALISIGFDEEAGNFMGWLRDRCASDRDGLLQPLYGIDGRAHIAESELDHLSGRSEEHTSELQSRQYLVCRLLLEKKNNK